MNPDDFARVDVLSDASATSIYGSRAANGVIYITTKRGQLETKGSVQARYTFGLSNLANTRYFEQIQNTREVFDMFEYLGTHTPAQVADLRARYGDRTFRWYKYYYRQNAPTHSANVQFTGVGGARATSSRGAISGSRGCVPSPAIRATACGQTSAARCLTGCSWGSIVGWATMSRVAIPIARSPGRVAGDVQSLMAYALRCQREGV